MKVTKSTLKKLPTDRHFIVFDKDDKMCDVISRQHVTIGDVNTEVWTYEEYVKGMKNCTMYPVEDIKPPVK